MNNKMAFHLKEYLSEEAKMKRPKKSFDKEIKSNKGLTPNK